jgi:hypothetical protein
VVIRRGEENEKTGNEGKIQISPLLVHELGNRGMSPTHPTAEISDPSWPDAIPREIPRTPKVTNRRHPPEPRLPPRPERRVAHRVTQVRTLLATHDPGHH